MIRLIAAGAVGAASLNTCPSMAPGGPAKKVLLTDAAAQFGAKCLDGTPGAYYFEAGTGDGVDKWYVHHEGGGWCESMDDCLARSTMGLGSSKGYPESVNLGGGYFDSNCEANPLMCNWNKVFMRYCDGASFSGNNETVAEHKGKSLFWRGHRIREATVAHLMPIGLAKATDLVVSGCSAGGLATYLHTDQWCGALKEKNPAAKCVGLPDSGFFLDYQDPTVPCTPASGELRQAAAQCDSEIPSLESCAGTTINGNYHCGLKWAYTIQNATAGVHQGCLAAHAADEWKCMFAEHAAEHIEAPLFALQSQYDTWQIGNVQGRGGAAKTAVLGANITARLQSNLLARNKESGAFLDSCAHHCGNWNSIRIDGDLVSVALQKWYNSIGQPGAKKLWNQAKPYPCVACCTPVAEDIVIV